jgi:ankyrin repeat protein
MAAARGSLQLADFFLSRKLQINAVSVEGGPIHLAAEAGNGAMVEFLLSKGAEVNLKANKNVTALHLASSGGRREVVKALILRGADVNAADTEGGTPLHRAAEGGYADILQALISRGGEVNLKDSQGKTPLFLARSNNRKEAADFLQKSGAAE